MQVFWQSTLDLHSCCSGGGRKDWLPGRAKQQQQELPPQEGGRTVDHTEGLLMRRAGQLHLLKQVSAAPGANIIAALSVFTLF